VRWLERNSYNHQSIAAILEEQTVTLIGLFLHSIAASDTIQAHCSATIGQPSTLVAKTLTGCANAAKAWLSFHFQKMPPIYQSSSISAKPSMHPFLATTITQRWNWKEPQKKKEPCTSPMFLVLFHDVCSLSSDFDRLLDHLPAVFDWCRLGIFTGFPPGRVRSK
jgi:hypothetical protein